MNQEPELTKEQMKTADSKLKGGWNQRHVNGEK